MLDEERKILASSILFIQKLLGTYYVPDSKILDSLSPFFKVAKRDRRAKSRPRTLESWLRPFCVWFCLLLPSPLHSEAATGPRRKKSQPLLHHRVLQLQFSSPVAEKARSDVTPRVCSALSFEIHPESFQIGSSVRPHSIESVCLYSPRRRVRRGRSKAKVRRPYCARAIGSRWSHRWSRPEGSKSPEPSGTEHRRGREREQGPGGGVQNWAGSGGHS